jgi:hypothetical protein
MSEFVFSVWVDGLEMNAFYLNWAEAEAMARDCLEDGYAPVIRKEVF